MKKDKNNPWIWIKNFLITGFFAVGVFVAPDFTHGAFFSDGFESGDLTHSESGTHWGGEYAPQVTISNTLSHAGQYSMRFRYPATAPFSDSSAEEGFYLGQHKTDIYIRYYIYFPLNYEHRYDPNDGVNNKLLALFQDRASYSTNPVTMLAEFESLQQSGGLSNISSKAFQNGVYGGYYFSYEPGSFIRWDSNLPTWNLTSQDLGRWICWEWHMKRDSGSGNGAFELWVDGVRVGGISNMAFADAASFDGYFGEGYLMGWSNSGFSQETDIYIDDVVFSDSYIGTGDSSDTTAPTSPSGLNVS